MPVRPNFNPDYLYFVTTTTEKHAHHFAPDSIKRIILDSLQFLRNAGRMSLYAFVIMPNHVHFIANFTPEHPLAHTMRDFKRHTARSIILQGKFQNDSRLLASMHRANRDRRQTYKIWEDGYDARDIFTSQFLQQKLDYVHYNPCQPHWHLSDSPEDYPWSSAGFYLADRSCIIPIDDLRELF